MGPAAPDFAGDVQDAAELRTIRHDTFAITRTVAAPPHAVFEAFSDAALRARWFRLPGRTVSARHDFAVDGGETASSRYTAVGTAPQTLEYASRYLDIVPDARIVYTYTSAVDGIRRWASLVTVELHPDNSGTRLLWTEQAAFLAPSAEPEHDLPHLRGATRLRLNGLAAALKPT
ncbi:SRPBCC domain-containing protein [Embleya sp. NPDC050493]|uniref:SRPBCC domain-containing protein n=1 Tax=Embleya sp. NPDC050493 TaxID=3363989 RepID=UPI0037B03F4A